MLILIFDSKTRSYINTFRGNINIYSCGVTPYKHTHIGNLRVEIIINVIKNIYKQFGYECKHVSNITDIGYIENSESTTQQLNNFVSKNYVMFIYKYWETYFNDIKLVVNNVAEIYPASNFIKQNIQHINKIINKPYVITNTEGIYIDTSHKHFDKSQLINNGKRVQNFFIWKNKQNGLFKYCNNYGIPGWHIECFSIINSVFTKQCNNYVIEIHAGGIDLMDIHNNCEIIHHYLEHNNYNLARIWLNVNLLLTNGVKMSKSANNNITLQQILNEMNISEFMIMILSTHYQKQINVNSLNKQQAINKYCKIIKNFITQIITYKNFKNIYQVYNFLQNLKSNNSEHKKSTQILEKTNLLRNINTVNAISYLQQIQICKESDIYDFYIIDSVINTQIINTLICQIKNNIQKQYIYDKCEKPTNKTYKIKVIVNKLVFYI